MDYVVPGHGDSNAVVVVPGHGASNPVVIRTTEDILAFIQRKNPAIATFDHEGRQCIRLKDLYMAVCDVRESAANSRMKYLYDNDLQLHSRIVKYKQLSSESPPPTDLNWKHIGFPISCQ